MKKFFLFFIIFLAPYQTHATLDDLREHLKRADENGAVTRSLSTVLFNSSPEEGEKFLPYCHRLLGEADRLMVTDVLEDLDLAWKHLLLLIETIQIHSQNFQITEDTRVDDPVVVCVRGVQDDVEKAILYRALLAWLQINARQFNAWHNLPVEIAADVAVKYVIEVMGHSAFSKTHNADVWKMKLLDKQMKEDYLTNFAQALAQNFERSPYIDLLITKLNTYIKK